MIPLLLFFTGYFSIVFIVKKSHFLLVYFISKSERAHLHHYYLTRFVYYKQLSTQQKKKFIYRTYLLRKANKLKVHDDIRHVYQDIELMLSAAFAQITFGYTDFTISSFSKIIIYPDSFYSKLAGEHVNGLTVGNGYIYLSWKHFLKGYQNTEDKVNLALHELAHAIYIDRFHYRKDLKWYQWEEIASPVFKQINNQEEITFFRPYAKTNMAEFWAVCIECFFEDPKHFKLHFPDLYNATCRLLKQDLLKLKY
jgi:Mlc titration factor MtfA (ptsG expression regulator)